MVLSQDFREFLELLNEKRVEYLVVGGYAVVVHGYPRLTGDIDIWVRPTLENGRRVVSILREFGFGGLSITGSDFLAPDRIIELGYPPVRIDLMTSIGTDKFESCFDRRKVVNVDGVSINFIGFEDLKRSKRVAGRPRDIDDLTNLTKIKKPRRKKT